jgi:hypothetical protein
MESRLELLEQRLDTTERRLHRAERRQRATWVIAVGGVVGAFALGMHPEAQAQFAITLTSLQNQINALATRVTAVENKTQFVSVSGGDMFITGTNLHIRNGLNATNGNPADPFHSFALDTFVVNGKGNLIVGYNALRGDENDRSGSHNIILGDGNNYTRFGGIVAGQFNTINGLWSSVTGGISNTASGWLATVTGGQGNNATGQYASISGGFGNTATGLASSVSGGGSLTQGTTGGWSAGSEGGSTVVGNFRSP